MYAYKKLPSTEADLMDKRGLLLLKIEGEKRKEAEEEDTDGVEFDKRQIDGGHRKVPEKAIVFAQMNELLRQDDNSRNNEVKFLDACVSGWVARGSITLACGLVMIIGYVGFYLNGFPKINKIKNSLYFLWFVCNGHYEPPKFGDIYFLFWLHQFLLYFLLF